MMRRKTHEEFLVEVRKAPSGLEYEFLEQYAGAKNLLLVKHNCGFEWRISPTNFLSGKRCPQCAGVKKYTLDEAKQMFDGRGFDLTSCSYRSANDPLEFVCRKHREYGVQRTTLSLVRQGGGCRICGNENISAGQLHNTSMDWVRNIFDDAGLVLLEDEYRGRHHRYLCECKQHGAVSRTKVSLNNIYYNQQGGCRLCASAKIVAASRTPEETIKNMVESAGLLYEGVTYVDRSEGKTTVHYRCPKHRAAGVMHKTLDKLKSGQGCPHCRRSHGEKAVATYLHDHAIGYVPQFKSDDLRGVGGGLLSYDFYVPAHNLLIEFQGRQHREYNVAFHRVPEMFEVQKTHDRLKRDYASAHGYRLLEIWDYQIDDVPTILEDCLRGVVDG